MNSDPNLSVDASESDLQLLIQFHVVILHATLFKLMWLNHERDRDAKPL